MAARGVARSIKNYAKGFSDAQIKVREATSNDPWGPSGTIMNEIAQLTYNEHDFVEIMDMIDRRLNDKGKNWRHVFKALLVLDYCLHVGSDNVVLYLKENIYVVKTLKEFQHVDDTGRDVGANVRQKAKDITSLLADDARLKEERQSRHSMRDRMASVGDYLNESLYGRGYDGTQTYGRPGDEDREMQRAMEESRRAAQSTVHERDQGDADLAKAIEESEREARELEQRKRDKLARENEKNLLDDSSDLFAPVTIQQPQQTGMSTFSGVPLGAQSNPYHWNQMQAQMTGMPQQPTGAQPFQTNPMMNPQYTSSMSGGFNSAMPTGSLPNIQALSTGNLPHTMSPLGQQPTTMGSPSMMMNQSAAAAAPKQTPMVTGTNNPFGPAYKAAQSNAATQQANPINPQHTKPIHAQQPVAMQQTGMSMLSSSAPSSTMLQSHPVDPRHAKLDSLLANRDDGQDTFGNTGNMRVPIGTGFASTLKPEPTGKSNSTGDLLGLNSNTSTVPFSQTQHNPFAPQHTGMHQQSTGSLF